MDYEKKYKNALTIARSRFKIEKDESVLTCLGMMFPELRENEDEKIRQFLIERMKSLYGANSVTPEGIAVNDIVSYLEKQKEPKLAPDDLQKSFEAGQASIVDNPEQYGLCKKAEWSEEDETIIEGACSALEIHGHDKLASKLKSLRPVKQEWSKADENKIERLTFLVSVAEEKEMISPSESIDLRNFIKSIRPQPSWVTNEELLGALDIVANLPELEFYGGIKDKIRELNKLLKKL